MTCFLRYPNTACELLTSDVAQITDKLAGEEALLNKIYTFLESEGPLNPLLASFFSKVMGLLITRKSEMVSIIGILAICTAMFLSLNIIWGISWWSLDNIRPSSNRGLPVISKNGRSGICRDLQLTAHYIFNKNALINSSLYNPVTQ